MLAQSRLQTIATFRRFGPRVADLDLSDGPFQRPKLPHIEAVCSTLWKRKGKRLRSHFVHWFGEMAGVDSQALSLYAWAVEAIHTATLLHDDVIDKASVRRGGPSANALYDNTPCILSGDYLMCDVVAQLADRGHPRLLKMLCDAIKDLTSGECWQYSLRYQIPESAQCFDSIATLKTTSLFKWAALVGPVLADLPPERTTHFVEAFGLLFQFSDDLLDIKSNGEKAAWVDLREGKLNAATFRVLETAPQLRRRLEQAFRTQTLEANLFDAYQDESASAKARLSLSMELKTREKLALQALQALPPGEIQSALGGLVEICAERAAHVLQ